MSFDQYHEPPEELSPETRTFARMITSLIEEAEAIGWYEQRLSLEKDRQARAIMKNAQHEEMKHFGMDLEFLLRKKPQWREVLQGILFTKGDIVKLGDDAEDAAAARGRAAPPPLRGALVQHLSTRAGDARLLLVRPACLRRARSRFRRTSSRPS
jgi:hypothetical protein